MKLHQWHNSHSLTLLLPDMDDPGVEKTNPAAVALMFNAADEAVEYSLPGISNTGGWSVVFQSGPVEFLQPGKLAWILSPRSMVCALYNANADNN